jgi:putative selenium metabolism protein SsnA
MYNVINVKFKFGMRIMIIKNGWVVTWEKPNRILKGHSIKIKDGIIVNIAPDNEIKTEEGEETVDAHSQLVMPGNICAHTHYYGAFARGMAIPGSPPGNFTEILSKLWWQLDRVITEEDIRLSTEVCLLDAIRHGTTTLVDHHASPGYIEGSLNIIASSIKKAGLRGCLCYEVTDRGGNDLAEAGIKENINFIKETRHNKEENIAALFGLHAGLTLSDKTLEKSRELAPEGIGFHIHVAEDAVDEYNSLQNYGLRVIDRLDKFEILSSNTILAHAVHIDAKEMEIIKQKKCWVSHQPRSNMNNGVGVADVTGMMRLGIPVCMGNDGLSNSMWDEWKTAYFVHKLWNLDPRRMPADLVVEMGVYNNAALATQLFGGQIGVLRKGAKADLIFVDYRPFTPMNTDNLPWHIIFGFREGMVSATMVGGKFLMLNNQILTMDEELINAKALELSTQVWERFQNIPDLGA